MNLKNFVMDGQQTAPNYAIRVMVFKDGKILLGKNKSGWAGGKYGFTGGHLEYLESFENCARREAAEECGIEIENIQFHSVYNNADDKPYHNIHLMFTANWKSGEAKVCEPEKSESWDWYDLDNLPSPLFKNVELFLKSYKTGKTCFDLES
jgi:8-oxo-dGTP diphosphatase